MNNIYLLTDYKGYFSSKYTANPYRSGMDKKLLSEFFKDNGYNAIFLSYPEIDFRDNDYKNEIFLYTSSEDIGGYYKDYIEDILLGLELRGAKLIPDYKYFRAHNNKVFMEILRDISDNMDIHNIKSKYFGTKEDAEKYIEDKNKNFVIKTFSGATSIGVTSSKNQNDFEDKIKRVSKPKNLFYDTWDFVRAIKHKGYIKESHNRKKFIVQNMIEGLKNDWKVLIFGKKYYVLYRGVRDNDFRASGSGKFEYIEKLPEGFLDYCEKIYNFFNVPNLSIDIGFDGKQFYLFEFQAIYFGTHTLDTSPYYYIKKNNKWEIIYEKSIVEKEYVNSVIYYLNNKNG